MVYSVYFTLFLCTMFTVNCTQCTNVLFRYCTLATERYVQCAIYTKPSEQIVQWHQFSVNIVQCKQRTEYRMEFRIMGRMSASPNPIEKIRFHNNSVKYYAVSCGKTDSQLVDLVYIVVCCNHLFLNNY